MRWHKADETFVVPFEDLEFSYYVRTSCDSRHDALENAKLIIGDVRELSGSPKGCAEFVTGPVKEADMQKYIASGSLGKVESLIRILD